MAFSPYDHALYVAAYHGYSKRGKRIRHKRCAILRYSPGGLR